MNYNQVGAGTIGDYAAKEACVGQMMITSRETTVAQNIDNRIASLREQIARLDAVKQKLSRGTILDVSLEDLQMALGRY